MRTVGALKLLTLVALAAGPTTAVMAQEAPAVSREASVERVPPGTSPARAEKPTAPESGAEQSAQAPTREAAIEQEQAAKVQTLHPYVPNKAEAILRPGSTPSSRAARCDGTRSSRAPIRAAASRSASATRTT